MFSLPNARAKTWARSVRSAIYWLVSGERSKVGAIPLTASALEAERPPTIIRSGLAVLVH